MPTTPGRNAHPTDQSLAPRLAYLLGRRCAPLFLRTGWILKSLAGSEADRIEAEYRMGCLLAHAYEGKIPAGENNRLSDIAAQLESRLRNRQRLYGFKLDQSGVPNALALPGGFVYVSEVLFDRCGEDRDAIAFVLAHEIAHCIHGDAAKRFLTKAAIHALLRLRPLGATPVFGQLLAHLVKQGYSRDQEFRADRFALALCTAAGFDPRGGCRLFADLRSQAGEAGRLGAYFSSHPAFSDRIERMEARIREMA